MNDVGITVKSPSRAAKKQYLIFKFLLSRRARIKKRIAGMKEIPKSAYKFMVRFYHFFV